MDAAGWTRNVPHYASPSSSGNLYGFGCMADIYWTCLLSIDVVATPLLVYDRQNCAREATATLACLEHATWLRQSDVNVHPRYRGWAFVFKVRRRAASRKSLRDTGSRHLAGRHQSPALSSPWQGGVSKFESALVFPSSSDDCEPKRLRRLGPKERVSYLRAKTRSRNPHSLILGR